MVVFGSMQVMDLFLYTWCLGTSTLMIFQYMVFISSSDTLLDNQNDYHIFALTMRKSLLILLVDVKRGE